MWNSMVKRIEENSICGVIYWNGFSHVLRATSHTRLRARDPYTSSALMHGKGKVGPSPLPLRFRDQWSMWMRDGCKVCMDSYMASNGSWFMVTWINFKNRLLEAGLTQIRKSMALWTLTIVGLFYFYHVWEGLAWIDIHWNSIWLRLLSHMSSHYTWRSVPHYMILEVSWDGLWTLSFGLSQFHGHGSWLVCEVAVKPDRLSNIVVPIKLLNS